MKIHPTAAIERGAELDSTVEVGPGAVIGGHVRIGPATKIGPHAVIEGRTTIGARNRIFQFASIGSMPQDLKYRGEPSRVEIGDDNQVREFVTIHRGTEGGGLVTRIGSDVLLMNYTHIGHDCTIGDHCILANSSEMAGHIVLEDWVRAMGICGVHQFCRIGTHALIAAGSMVAQDVPPYAMVAGDRARLKGVHEELLRRRDFPPETTAAVKRAFRTLFYSGLIRDEAIRQVLDRDGSVAEVRRLIDFINDSKRGVVGRARG